MNISFPVDMLKVKPRYNDLEALLTLARVTSIVIRGVTDWSLLKG